MLDFDIVLLVTSMTSSFAASETPGDPIRKMLDFEVMWLVISVTSGFADVETSRGPYTKNVGFRSHVACIL